MRGVGKASSLAVFTEEFVSEEQYNNAHGFWYRVGFNYFFCKSLTINNYHIDIDYSND